MLRGLFAGAAFIISTTASAVPYAIGDVFASIGNGLVDVYSQTGVLKQTLDTTKGGFTTGSTFDSAGNFYVTAFSGQVVSKFDNNGVLLNANWANGISNPESIVFDGAGNAYIGNAGSSTIQKVNSSGTQINSYATLQNTDWIDLAADQKTLLYSNEGSTIRELNTDTLVDTVFTTGSYGDLFAKRYLGDGSVLAASSTGNVYHWDVAGVLIDTYAIGIGSVFALNLDPDGTSFWTGSTGGTAVKKIDIATGNTLQSWNTRSVQGLYGLAVYGEIQAGGGGVDNGGGGDNGVPLPGTLLLMAGGLFAGRMAARRKAV